jgi:hypothetical protein
MKKWYRSKTILFNALMATLIALEASLSQLSSVIPANWYGILATVLAVGNAFLRVITNSGVSK